eukprot:scaffold155593_cov33-Tisochrysis_lutea.AAC.1
MSSSASALVWTKRSTPQLRRCELASMKHMCMLPAATTSRVNARRRSRESRVGMHEDAPRGRLSGSRTPALAARKRSALSSGAWSTRATHARRAQLLPSSRLRHSARSSGGSSSRRRVASARDAPR